MDHPSVSKSPSAAAHLLRFTVQKGSRTACVREPTESYRETDGERKKLVTFGGSWPDKPLSLSLSISSTLSFLLRRSLPEDKTGFRRESVHHFSMPAHGSHCHCEKINLWHHQPTGIKRVTGAGPAIWCIRGLRWTACRFYKLWTELWVLKMANLVAQVAMTFGLIS